MKLKKFDQLNENVTDKGISAYDSVWVVFKYGGYDIDKIYLNKHDAEIIAKQKTQEYYDYYSKINTMMSKEEYDDHFNRNKNAIEWKVITLDNAIDQIKEHVEDTYNQNEDY